MTDNNRIFSVNDEDIIGFEPPHLFSHRDMVVNDKNLISNLRNELKKSGVITDDDQSAIMADDNIDNIMNIANDHALYEKDFNAEFYDEDAENYFQMIDDNHIEYDNPIIEDY